ncbi:MAG: DUF1489 domain-containing protein [Rhodobacteraceae bacterium]|jgi:hypothetical protein|nr:DUF1489 domain-containing protein [Paracoccaceae bacterium]
MLHLQKLCVGADSVEDLTDWQRSQRHRWPTGTAIHVTRMWPKRAAEMEGGSLFWVIKGLILCRQRILGFEEARGEDGILRCAIHLDAQVILTESIPRRPFQGWRYMEAKDAPRDIPKGRKQDAAIPPELARALADIGLR